MANQARHCLFKRMGRAVLMNKYLKYLNYVLRHKWFVLKAGLELKVNLWQLLIHDLSKFLPDEFIPYARYFNGDYPDWHEVKYQNYTGPTKQSVAREFDKAWLKHQHRNPHHWQHWVLREDSGAIKLLPMPDRYRREMLADWIGAGLAITGKLEVWNWYEKTVDSRMLDSSTKNWVEGEIARIYTEQKELAKASSLR